MCSVFPPSLIPPLGTVHLESLEHTQTRMLQLSSYIVPILSTTSHCILTGDMNFSDEDPDGEALPETWQDAGLGQVIFVLLL